jgi:hypothetical protein
MYVLHHIKVTYFLRRNSIQHMGAYALAIGKTFCNVKKIQNFFRRLRIDILRTYIKFCKKKTNIFFNLCEKRQKKNVTYTAFFAPKFILFTHGNKNIGFPWNHFVNV